MRTENRLVIREVDRVADAAALRELDTSYASDFAYHVKSDGRSLSLSPVRTDPFCAGPFVLDLEEPLWSHGYVALEGSMLRGFVATSYEAWNRRLRIWHFYVDLHHRRGGIGRRLMDHAIAQGRRLHARTVWLEASNRNYPAVEAYRHLGFDLCGFDLTFYKGTPSAAEFAVFLARPIGGEPTDKPGADPDGASVIP